MVRNIFTGILSFLRKKIPAYTIVLLLATVVVIILSMKRPQKLNQVVAINNPSCNSTLKITRLSGALAEPMLMADVSDQSEELTPVKKEIQKYLDAQKDSGHLKVASLYLQKLNNGMWMSINNEQTYTSSGYIRLAILIWYLKKSEEHPSILEKKLSVNTSGNNLSLNSDHELQGGREYSVSELLRYLIVNSDSDAKVMLTRNIDTTEFEKVFTDLGMATPNLRDKEFFISVSEYSKFLRVLYDARYLNTSNSEFALKLLTENTSGIGMKSLLPSDVKVAHRFSSKFQNNGYDVRESEIVYADHNPYVLTVFTQGKNDDDLKTIIAAISKMVYSNAMPAQ